MHRVGVGVAGPWRATSRWLLAPLAALGMLGCADSGDDRPPLRSNALPRFQASLVSYACPVDLSRRDTLGSQRQYRRYLRALKRAWRADPSRLVRTTREVSDSSPYTRIENVTLRELVDGYIDFVHAGPPGELLPGREGREHAACERRFVRQMEQLKGR